MVRKFSAMSLYSLKTAEFLPDAKLFYPLIRNMYQVEVKIELFTSVLAFLNFSQNLYFYS